MVAGEAPAPAPAAITSSAPTPADEIAVDGLAREVARGTNPEGDAVAAVVEVIALLFVAVVVVAATLAFVGDGMVAMSDAKSSSSSSLP